MKTRWSLLLFTLVASVAGTPPRGHAAPITVDSTSQGPMNGFELFGSGLYWWNHGNYGNEVTPARTGQIALHTLLSGRYLVLSSSRTYLAYQSTSLRAPMQSVGRSDDDMFYFADTAVGLRFHKRALYGPSPAENDFSGVAYNEAGSIFVHGTTVYWNVRGGAAANNGEVRGKYIHGPPGGDTILRTPDLMRNETDPSPGLRPPSPRRSSEFS